MSQPRNASKLVAAVSAVVALVSGASREAAAYEVKHTPGGQVVRWSESSVTLVVDPSVTDEVAGGVTAFDAALHGWSGVDGSPSLSMSVGPGGGTPALDGQNTVLYAPQGFAPAGNALAVTVFSYETVSGRILDTDIVVNGQHAFAVLPDGAHPGAGVEPVSTEGGSDDDTHRAHDSFDIQHVFAHELGHVMGLGDDLETRDALMYAYTSPGDASLRVPTADDLDGIEVVYAGSPASAHSGCGRASVGGSRVNEVDAWAGLALLAGAGAWLTRRRGARVAVPVCAAGFILLSGSADARSATNHGFAGAADAHALVVSAEARNVAGVFQTTLVLAPTECRTSACPDRAETQVWGGSLGGITQVVGEHEVPRVGDSVDVTFADSPNGLAAASW